MTVNDFRRELRDKMAVFASAERGPIPARKAIVQQQCLDFIADLYRESFASRDAALAELAELRSDFDSFQEHHAATEQSWTAAKAEVERLTGLLGDLVAMVRGECPSLLNEGSGGDARLSLAIDAALAKVSE